MWPFKYFVFARIISFSENVFESPADSMWTWERNEMQVERKEWHLANAFHLEEQTQQSGEMLIYAVVLITLKLEKQVGQNVKS